MTLDGGVPSHLEDSKLQLITRTSFLRNSMIVDSSERGNEMASGLNFSAILSRDNEDDVALQHHNSEQHYRDLTQSLLEISEELIKECHLIQVRHDEVVKSKEKYQQRFNQYFFEFGDFEAHKSQIKKINERVTYFQDELLKREDQMLNNEQEATHIWSYSQKVRDELASKSKELEGLQLKLAL